MKTLNKGFKKKFVLAFSLIIALSSSLGFTTEKASAAYLEHYVTVGLLHKNIVEHMFGFHAYDSPGLEGRAVRYKIVNSSGKIVESGSTTLKLKYISEKKYVYVTDWLNDPLYGGPGTVYKVTYDMHVGSKTYIASGHVTLR